MQWLPWHALIATADVWQASSLHSKYTRRKSVEGVIDLLTAVGSQPVPALGPGTLSHSLQHSTRSHHELTPRRPLQPRMLSIPTCSPLFCSAPHLQPPKTSHRLSPGLGLRTRCGFCPKHPILCRVGDALKSLGSHPTSLSSMPTLPRMYCCAAIACLSSQ